MHQQNAHLERTESLVHSGAARAVMANGLVSLEQTESLAHSDAAREVMG